MTIAERGAAMARLAAPVATRLDGHGWMDGGCYTYATAAQEILSDAVPVYVVATSGSGEWVDHVAVLSEGHVVDALGATPAHAYAARYRQAAGADRGVEIAIIRDGRLGEPKASELLEQWHVDEAARAAIVSAWRAELGAG